MVKVKYHDKLVYKIVKWVFFGYFMKKEGIFNYIVKWMNDI